MTIGIGEKNIKQKKLTAAWFELPLPKNLVAAYLDLPENNPGFIKMGRPGFCSRWASI